MKKLLKGLIAFAREDFHPWAYLYVVLFMTAGIILNYKYDIGWNTVKENGAGPLVHFYFFIFYFIAYFGAAVPVMLIRGKPGIFQHHGNAIRPFQGDGLKNPVETLFQKRRLTHFLHP